MAYDIITIGAATRDAFLVSKQIQLISSDQFLTGIGECVALGTKIELDEMVLATGGGATNAAVTFGNLGFRTAAIARVGQDCSGAEIFGELEDHGVDTSMMRAIKGEQTAYSTLLTEPKGGERTVMVYRGVSAGFSKADLPFSKMKSDWIYMTSLAGNVPLAETIIKTLGKKTKICWNPGMKELNLGIKRLSPALEHLFLLNMNREEATALFRKDPIENPHVLAALPPTLTVVITDGAQGAYASLDGTTWFVKPSSLKARSRTGAGDAFGSGLVAGLMKGFGIEDALRLGLLNSQSVIQHYGAKAGILSKWPSKNELAKVSVKNV